VLAADILVLCGPIWLGDNSSVMKRVIERLYACSSLLNEQGQYLYYGRAGGCLITGNEDGVKHCAMNVLYSLQHLGYTIPAAGRRGVDRSDRPRPLRTSTPGSGGPENDFTNRNTTFMTFNLMHVAAMLNHNGGIPAFGISGESGMRDAGTTPRIRSTDEAAAPSSSPTTCSTGWRARRWWTRWVESTATVLTSSAWSAPRRAGCSGPRSRSRSSRTATIFRIPTLGSAPCSRGRRRRAGRKGAGAVERGLPRRVARRRNEALPA